MAEEKKTRSGQVVEATNEQIERRRQQLRAKKRKKQRRARILISLLLAIIVLGVAAGIIGGILYGRSHSGKNNQGNGQGQTSEQKDDAEKKEKEQRRADLMSQAEAAAAGYDYDRAIALLQTVENYQNDTRVSELISGYETMKNSLVEFPISDVTHIFFHTLINNCEKAFDGDYKEGDYNQVMTTVEEFNAIMQSMYERGYVLVSLRDMAGYVTHEDGTVTWEQGRIMLPEGKKAFVISQDDVSYYEYMDGDGYPSRLCIGEDGNITNEVINDDGTATYGSFDMVPLLEDFIAAHPDFSYKGARGYLALTGYDGVLGYRTADKYKESLGEEEWARQVEEAKKVVNRLLEQGWEFASHSWGHRYYGQISISQLQEDAQKWEAQVRPILENNGTYKVDAIIFAFGDDIGSWTPYLPDNERFTYLKSLGFHYFCNVDSNPVWVQFNQELEYLRQGRRNLDGQRMYYDMIDDSVDLLSDLFDVNEVFDKRRPTPVPK